MQPLEEELQGRSVWLEWCFGHMTNQKVQSVESGWDFLLVGYLRTKHWHHTCHMTTDLSLIFSCLFRSKSEWRARATSKQTGLHFQDLFQVFVCATYHHQPSLSGIMNHQEALIQTDQIETQVDSPSPIFYISPCFFLKNPRKPWGNTHTQKKRTGDEVVLDDNQPAGLGDLSVNFRKLLTYQMVGWWMQVLRVGRCYAWIFWAPTEEKETIEVENCGREAFQGREMTECVCFCQTAPFLL